MDGVLNLTKEHRKAIWRTSRKLIYSLLVTLAVVMVFFGVNPFHFWDTNFHLLLVLALWIVSYHLYEAVKSRVAI